MKYRNKKKDTNSNVKKFCLNIKNHLFFLWSILFYDQRLAQVAQWGCAAFSCGNLQNPATATAQSNLPWLHVAELGVGSAIPAHLTCSATLWSCPSPWTQLPEGTLTVTVSIHWGQCTVCTHFPSWVNQSDRHPSLPQEGEEQQEKKKE